MRTQNDKDLIRNHLPHGYHLERGLRRVTDDPFFLQKQRILLHKVQKEINSTTISAESEKLLFFDSNSFCEIFTNPLKLGRPEKTVSEVKFPIGE